MREGHRGAIVFGVCEDCTRGEGRQIGMGSFTPPFMARHGIAFHKGVNRHMKSNYEWTEGDRWQQSEVSKEKSAHVLADSGGRISRRFAPRTALGEFTVRRKRSRQFDAERARSEECPTLGPETPPRTGGRSTARYCRLLKIVGGIYLPRDRLDAVTEQHLDMAYQGSIAWRGRTRSLALFARARPFRVAG